MTSNNEERIQRYAKEIALACGYVDPLRQHQISARAAVAVADAELADLRAEVEQYRAKNFAPMSRINRAERVAENAVADKRAAERALADERARVARVEAVAVDPDFANGHVSVVRIRAALAGPEPDTTKDNQ